MAVPTAERDERAVEAIVPGAVFIHVPQTVLVPADRGSAEDDGQQRQSQRDEGHVVVARRREHPHPEYEPREAVLPSRCFSSVETSTNGRR